MGGFCSSVHSCDKFAIKPKSAPCGHQTTNVSSTIYHSDFKRELAKNRYHKNHGVTLLCKLLQQPIAGNKNNVNYEI